jgi:hypothetical protein
VLHHREVDQRLAALELDRDERAGAAQRESTAFSAISGVMSVWTASMLAREAWQ